MQLVSKSGILLAEFDVLDRKETVQLEDGSNSLADFMKIFSVSNDLLPASYKKASEVLGLSYTESIKTVPLSKLKSSIASIKEDLTRVMQCEDNVTYLSNYLKIRRFLDRLSTPLISKKTLQEIINSQKYEGVKNNLKSFITDKPTRYSMSNSATGRLSVVSGAKILTAPSEVKNAFSSRFKDGTVLQIDLTCAEPNFALFYSGKNPMRDLYEFCAKNVLDGRVDRNVAKLILLSTIYGQSEKNLKQNLPSGVSTSSVIKQVKKFLLIDKTNSKLESALTEKNFRNYIGRPLYTNENRLLISHFLQSSVAECALLMFAEFCNNEDVVPVFVIHDALIIDCKKEKAEELLSRDFSFDFANKKFPASVTRVA